MTIDRTSAPAAPSQSVKTGTVTGNSHATGAHKPDGPDSPSFLSVLTSIEPEEVAAPETPGVADADAQPMVSHLPPPPDSAGLLAQGLTRTLAVSEPDAATLAASANAGISAAPVLGAPAPAARVHGSSMRGAVSGAHMGKGGVDEAVDPRGAPVADPSSGPALQRAVEVEQKRHNMGIASSLNSAAVRSNSAREAAEEARADLRSAAPMRAADVSVAGGALSEALASVARGSASVRGADRPVPRPLQTPGGSATTGSWAEQAMAGANAPAGATYTIEAAAPLPEMAVAERVDYWISRGVQKAELQLDAFGGGSVEVSISVNGNEAAVTFRSDQPEARRLLQDAMGHLRELLEGQGLVLAGGYVGTSAQQEPGAQQRRSHTQELKSAVVQVEPHAMDAGLTLSRTSGRTVDLFV